MAELKTKQNDANVHDFIKSYADTEQKIKDSFEILEFMRKVTNFEPKMWGDSIIGFGSYHYKSERSKQEGDWPLVGFSPRKAAITLYVIVYGVSEFDHLLEKLGKFKMGKGCIYIKKFSDIDHGVLEQIIKETIKYMQTKYGVV